jgi:molybdopterin converting factor subunit 1
MTARPTITVEYFALFRSLAKKNEESLEFPAESGIPPVPALYETLRVRYGFPLERESVHVAVNDTYVSWEHPLQVGDRIVFIPPVSGG